MVGEVNAYTALCTKRYQWEYENEARLISYEPDVDGSFHSMPLDEGSHIEKIYFGYRSPDKHIETIKKILANQSHIKFYQMQSSPEDIYHLSSIEI